MDNRITKERFSRFWQYEWVKLIVIVLAICLGMTFLYDVTYPNIKDDKELKIFVYAYDKDSDKLSLLEGKIQKYVLDNGSSVRDVNISFLTSYSDSSETALLNFIKFQDGIEEQSDIYILPDVDDTSSSDYTQSLQGVMASDKTMPISDILSWGDINCPIVATRIRNNLSSHNVLRQIGGVDYAIDYSMLTGISSYFYGEIGTNFLIGVRKDNPNFREVLLFIDFILTEFN